MALSKSFSLVKLASAILRFSLLMAFTSYHMMNTKMAIGIQLRAASGPSSSNQIQNQTQIQVQKKVTATDIDAMTTSMSEDWVLVTGKSDSDPNDLTVIDPKDKDSSNQGTMDGPDLRLQVNWGIVNGIRLSGLGNVETATKPRTRRHSGIHSQSRPHGTDNSNIHDDDGDITGLNSTQNEPKKIPTTLDMQTASGNQPKVTVDNQGSTSSYSGSQSHLIADPVKNESDEASPATPKVIGIYPGESNNGANNKTNIDQGETLTTSDQGEPSPSTPPHRSSKDRMNPDNRQPGAKFERHQKAVEMSRKRKRAEQIEMQIQRQFTENFNNLNLN